MGVKHLTSFLNANKLVQPAQHTKESPTLPGIVIDGLAFAYHILGQCPQIPVAGGEYGSFCDRVELFFKAMIELEVHCVVIVDGVSGDEKLDTQLRREASRVDYYHQVLHASRVDDAPDSLAPPMLKQALCQTLRDQNVEYWVSDEEADAAVAHVAYERGWMVLSNDSDFAVFDIPGHTKYSPTHQPIDLPTDLTLPAY